MPYVTKQVRDEMELRPPACAGELTYCIQQQIQRYLLARGTAFCFEDLAVCLGSLEAAKIDFQERVLLEYEHGKLHKNGDVWASEILVKT